ncbi:MAG: hypothetical protein WBB29_09660 [Geitlerinemataceae cyanobacterium]
MNGDRGGDEGEEETGRGIDGFDESVSHPSLNAEQFNLGCGVSAYFLQ